MHIYIHTYVYTYILILYILILVLYIYIFIYLCMYILIYIYIFTHILHIHIHIHLHLHTYIQIYIYSQNDILSWKILLCVLMPGTTFSTSRAGCLPADACYDLSATNLSPRAHRSHGVRQSALLGQAGEKDYFLRTVLVYLSYISQIFNISASFIII